jgi:hypothetical protein
MIKERRPMQLQVILDEEHGRRFSPLSKEIRLACILDTQAARRTRNAALKWTFSSELTHHQFAHSL